MACELAAGVGLVTAEQNPNGSWRYEWTEEDGFIRRESAYLPEPVQEWGGGGPGPRPHRTSHDTRPHRNHPTRCPRPACSATTTRAVSAAAAQVRGACGA